MTNVNQMGIIPEKSIKQIPNKANEDFYINDNIIFANCVAQILENEKSPQLHYKSFCQRGKTDYRVNQMINVLEEMQEMTLDTNTKTRLLQILEFVTENPQILTDAPKKLGVYLNICEAVRKTINDRTFDFAEDENQYNIEWTALLSKTNAINKGRGMER